MKAEVRERRVVSGTVGKCAYLPERGVGLTVLHSKQTAEKLDKSLPASYFEIFRIQEAVEIQRFDFLPLPSRLIFYRTAWVENKAVRSPDT